MFFRKVAVCSFAHVSLIASALESLSPFVEYLEARAKSCLKHLKAVSKNFFSLHHLQLYKIFFYVNTNYVLTSKPFSHKLCTFHYVLMRQILSNRLPFFSFPFWRIFTSETCSARSASAIYACRFSCRPTRCICNGYVSYAVDRRTFVLSMDLFHRS